MAMLDDLKGIFTRKKSIEKIPMDEFRRERIRLDQEEQKYSRQLDAIEKNKGELFVKGKDESSDRQRVVLARRIKRLDAQAHNLEKHLRVLGREARTVDALIQIKESKKVLQDTGIGGLLAKMDMGELSDYVERATVDGQFHVERLMEVVKRVEEQDGVFDVEEEKDIAQIVGAMQEAKEASGEDADAAIKEGLRKVDEALQTGDESGETERR